MDTLPTYCVLLDPPVRNTSAPVLIDEGGPPTGYFATEKFTKALEVPLVLAWNW
jgi:hypothetical protein